MVLAVAFAEDSLRNKRGFGYGDYGGHGGFGGHGCCHGYGHGYGHGMGHDYYG